MTWRRPPGYIGLAGQLLADGGATIANQQWKNRGYTSVEAIQVRVVANARTNSSTIRLNVNGSDVGTTLTINAGATGLIKVTGMGQAIAGGDLICLSLTLGSGVEDLTLGFVGVTLKSTSGKSEIFAHNQSGLVRAASGTASYYSVGGHFDNLVVLSEANTRLKAGFAARISDLRTFLIANTYGGNSTLKLYVNGSAAITLTIAGGATGWQENSTDIVDIDDNDEVSLELDEGTSGSATFSAAGFTFSPPIVPLLTWQFRQRWS